MSSPPDAHLEKLMDDFMAEIIAWRLHCHFPPTSTPPDSVAAARSALLALYTRQREEIATHEENSRMWMASDSAARSEIASLSSQVERQQLQIKELIKQLVEDTHQLEAQREDMRRLDWLQDYRDGFYNIDRISADRKGFNGLQTIRSAIDGLRLRSLSDQKND